MNELKVRAIHSDLFIAIKLIQYTDRDRDENRIQLTLNCVCECVRAGITKPALHICVNIQRNRY